MCQHRSYAVDRMDCSTRMAPASDNSVPKPQSRSCYLRLPLRLRVLRRHEGIQNHRRANTAFPPGQEHGTSKQVLCKNSPPDRRAQCFHQPHLKIRLARRTFHPFVSTIFLAGLYHDDSINSRQLPSARAATPSTFVLQ